MNEFPIFHFFFEFCIFYFLISEKLYEILSGFRDKFQKRVTCVKKETREKRKKSDVCRFFNRICENKLESCRKLNQNSEICEHYSLLFIIVHYFSLSFIRVLTDEQRSDNCPSGAYSAVLRLAAQREASAGAHCASARLLLRLPFLRSPEAMVISE